MTEEVKDEATTVVSTDEEVTPDVESEEVAPEEAAA